MIRNHHLAKSIADSSWSEFTRQILYKADWYGKIVNKIPMFYPSSKTCSNCGYMLPKLSLNVRLWTCPECGTIHDRDINTIRAGYARINACGEVNLCYTDFIDEASCLDETGSSRICKDAQYEIP